MVRPFGVGGVRKHTTKQKRDEDRGGWSHLDAFPLRLTTSCRHRTSARIRRRRGRGSNAREEGKSKRLYVEVFGRANGSIYGDPRLRLAISRALKSSCLPAGHPWCQQYGAHRCAILLTRALRLETRLLGGTVGWRALPPQWFSDVEVPLFSNGPQSDSDLATGLTGLRDWRPDSERPGDLPLGKQR